MLAHVPQPCRFGDEERVLPRGGDEDEEPAMAAQPKFTLGRVCRTLNAVNRLPAEEVLKAIARHAVGDWGALNAHDRRANKRSLGRRGRLVSVYQASNGSRFDVITDTGWAATKVLLPGDF